MATGQDSFSFPARDSIVDRAGRATLVLIQWATSLKTFVDAATQLVKAITPLTDQSASLPVTSIPSGSLPAGLYRVSYYARITQAASVSSSLTVTIAWTESAIALTLSGAAMTGNTTTTVQSGSAVIRIDAPGPVSYSTTYASAGGTPMKYRLDVTLERVA